MSANWFWLLLTVPKIPVLRPHFEPFIAVNLLIGCLADEASKISPIPVRHNVMRVSPIEITVIQCVILIEFMHELG